MRKLLALLSIIVSVTSFGQGDVCSLATNLGTLPAPAGCPGGAGTLFTYNGTTNGATAENPYSSLACMDAPAADVWVSFVASGNEMTLDFTSGLSDANIGIYTGDCSNLVGVFCEASNNGNISTTLQPFTPGETYYMQISGIDETDYSDFTLELTNYTNCDLCAQDGTVSANPAPVNGYYLPGQTVEFCLTITEYTQVSTNWIHSIQPSFGAGWDVSTLTPVSSPNASGSYAWIWTDPAGSDPIGWWVDDDPNGPATGDGNPTNNFGDNGVSGSGNWTWCWQITTDASCTPGADLGMSVNTTADGETGSWTSVACGGDPDIPFVAAMICCDVPIVSSTPTTCLGDADGTASATGQGGVAPYDYVWENSSGTTVFTDNNNAGTSTATGLLAGTYTVTVTDDLGCEQIYDIVVVDGPDCACFMTNLTVTDPISCDPSDNNFDIIGFVDFISPPATGNLIVTDCNGNQDVIPAPFAGPMNFSILDIPSTGQTNCTLTAYFDADPACSLELIFDYPNECACSAAAGTFTQGTTAGSNTNSAGPIQYNLCFGDQLDITANGDYTPPNDLSTTFTTITYDPGMWLLVYDCPPTIGTPDDINTDPCLLGVASTADQAWSILNDAGDNSTLWFVPVTMYSMVDGIYAVSINGGEWCYDLGPTYEITYLEEVLTTFTQDCQAGTATVTVNGGLPSLDGSNFTASNLSPANASFNNTTATDGGTITISGLVDGDNWSFDMVDSQGCPVTVSGTFIGTEDPTFTYPNIEYCIDAADPSPTISGVAGGTFTAPAGVSINANTGVIDLSASTAGGPYTITYTTPDPICFDQATFDITINPLPIVGGNPGTVCLGDPYTLNGTGADTYTWTGGVTDGVPFTPAGTADYTVTGTITATGCTNTAIVTVTVDPLDDPSFTTTNFCAGTPSTTPTVTGLPGGTFAFNPVPTDGATINAASGAISNGVGGTTYTIEYTTNGACPQSSTQTIEVYALPLVDVPDYSVCTGGSIDLTATGANTYTWSPGTYLNTTTGATVTSTPAAQIDYTVTGTDANGCQNSDITTVTIIPNAPIDAGLDVTICNGESTDLTATGGVSYTWQAPISAAGATQTVSPTATTVYTVDGVDAQGCTGTDQVTVTVNPVPTVDPVASPVLCANENTTAIAFTGSEVGTTYSWTNDNTSIGLAASGTGDISSFTVTNTGATQLIANIEVTPSLNGCTGTPVIFTITVNPIPTVNPILDQTVCALTSTSDILFSGNIGSTTYDWVNTNGSIGVATSGSGNILSFTGQNAGTAQIQGDFTVTPTAAGCVGTPETFSIFVNPIPTVTPISDQTLCAGDATADVFISGPVTGTVFDWANSNIGTGLATNGTGDILSFTATNSGSTQQVSTITVTPTAAGCQGPLETFDIIVNPTPTVNPVANEVLCAGEATTAVTFTGNVTGTTYTWVNSNTAIGLPANGTGNISSFAVSNTTGAPITADITVTPTAAGCPGTPIVYTITVNPIPVVDPIADQTLCANTNTATVNFTGNVAGANYAWTNDNTSIGVGAAGNGDITSFSATNNGTAQVVANFEVIPSANGCIGTAETFAIYVNPIPVVDPIADQTLCANTNTSTVAFTSTTTGTTFAWTNDNTTVGLASAGTGTIGAFTAQNNTASAQTANIVVTPTAAGCTGLSESFSIIVNPLPTATIAGSTTICENDPSPSVTFTGANGTAPYTFTYNINGGTAQTVTSVGNVATVTVPSTPTGTFNYNLVSVEDASSTACSQNQSGTATIVINPNPTPTIDGATEYCTGSTATLTTPIAYAGYQWSTGATTATVNVTAADNPITVTVTNGFGCTGTSPVFTVTENNVITYNSTVEICQGETATIHGVSQSTDGVYSQTFTLPTGCDSTSNVTLIVNPLPVIDAGIDQVECFGTGIILNATGAPTITWDNGVTNGVSFTPAVGTVTYTATGTDANGCVNTDQVDVTINPIPTVDPIADQTVCNTTNTATVTFTGSVVGTTFDWTNDNSTIGLASAGTGNINSFTGTNAGTVAEVATIVVTPTAAGCTGLSESFMITVDPTPIANNVTDQELCNTATTNQITFGASVANSTFTWVNDNTTIGLAGSGSGNIAPFTATNTTTAQTIANVTVTPTANGCIGVDEVFTIAVNPTPTVDNVADEVLCNGESTTDVVFTSPVTGTTFAWSNNNGQIGLGANGTAGIPSFVATNNGTSTEVAVITVVPTAAGCQGPSNDYSITVNPTPNVNTINDQVLCNGSSTTAVTISGGVTGTVYNWVNSDPTIGLASTGSGNIGAFNAVNNGTTPVVATIVVTPTANGCDGPTETFTITVNPTPVISNLVDETLCNNTLTSATSFVSSVTGSTFAWTNTQPSIGLAASGNGDIAAFNATNGGTSQVVATISVTPSANGCQGLSDTYTITVNPTPTVNAILDQELCNNTNTAMVSFSGGVAGTTYDWVNDNTAIGLGASGTGAIASFVATNTTASPISGNITVTPTAAGCTGSSEIFTITVNPTPVVDPIADQELCAGDNTNAIAFNSTTVGTTFGWTNTNTAIGIGASGSGNIPSFTAVNTAASQISGTFQVTPTADGCVGLAETFVISVNPLPTATISGTAELCDGDAAVDITFTGANGTAPYIFTYNVNNGGNQTVTSTGATATVTAPNTPGVYTYNLVSVQDGSSTQCSQSVTGTATVTVNDLPNVSAGSDFVVCQGNTAILTGSGASTYTWTGGVTDGVPFSPTTDGTYTVTGTDANGCVNTDDVFITVEELPAVSFVADVVSGCAPLEVTFTNTTPGNMTNCIWTLSNGTTLNGCGTVSTVFTTGGTYDVTLTTESSNGCTSTATYQDYIYVENPPVASFTADPYVMTQLYTEVQFNNTSTGATNYTWDFGDGSSTSTQTSPTHTFPNEEAGVYQVELIATTPLGCADTAYRSIVVNEELIFYVPNTFTPDGDDFNEYFKAVFTSGYDPFDFHMMIFNRWGELIWESYDASVGWDGTYGVDKNFIVQDGTYTWKIDFKTTMTDERILRVGHVNVLK